MKDLFSSHAKVYATFRPDYPAELYKFILALAPGREAAWDCATGNGQVAKSLAPHFAKVFATDISAKQIENATKEDNIVYAVAPAETTTFPNHYFDLITVAQALHWIDTERFYTEARRVAKPGAIIAVWGYNLPRITPPVDALIDHFYSKVVGQYWDSARRHVEEEYANIPYPFDQIETPLFSIRKEWTVDELAGYLTSWSATQKYTQSNNHNPVNDVLAELKPLWGDEKKVVQFRLFTKFGRIK